MAPSELRELIERAQDDDFQSKLNPGFQRSFVSSVVSQFERTGSLSPRQEEVLRDLLDQYDAHWHLLKRNTRRYEGF